MKKPGTKNLVKLSLYIPNILGEIKEAHLSYLLNYVQMQGRNTALNSTIHARVEELVVHTVIGRRSPLCQFHEEKRKHSMHQEHS